MSDTVILALIGAFQVIVLAFIAKWVITDHQNNKKNKHDAL